MTGRDFLNSKWVELAQRPGAAQGMALKLAQWTQRYRNTRLITHAKKLWNYFRSEKASKGQKIIILAGLIYLISPLDVVPDFIPFAGLLDDMGVAVFVLNYILKKVDQDQIIKGTEITE
jgi:uncharacterized membrane protein YkvA (DUF1232 family)